MGYLSLQNIIYFVCSTYFGYTALAFYQVFFPTPCYTGLCVSPTWSFTDQFSISTKLILGDKIIAHIHQTPLNISNVDEAIRIHPQIEHPLTKELRMEVALLDKNGQILFVNKVNLVENRVPSVVLNHKFHNKVNTTLPQPHIQQNFDLAFFFERFAFEIKDFPPEFTEHTTLRRLHNGYTYTPPFFMNSLMNSDDDFVPYMRFRNGSYPELEFNLQLKYCGLGNMRLRTSLVQSFAMLKSYGFKRKDFNEIKQLLLENSFTLLMTIILVTVIHICFDFLSLKSDVQFWRQTKDTYGLAPSTMIWNFVSKIIILLYLVEERSSLLVTVPAFASTLVDLWKMKKLFKVSSFSLTKGIRCTDKCDTELATESFDKEYTRKSLFFFLPLLLMGLIYSHLYIPYKGFYNWTITTLVRGVYAFGFLLMTPQLYVNYRLKSVAHLPWKSLTYKAFNTFIDDFFAFIIYMPTAHRLACFRDDVVFILYLYQRWLYPVDKTRKSPDILPGEETTPEVTPPAKKDE